MLIILKALSVTKWTWSGAGYVRKSPSKKQNTAPNFTLVFLRARYYDTATGEFISRDPLGYVDGMSLYRGYFVPSGTDPSGMLLLIANTKGVNTKRFLNNFKESAAQICPCFKFRVSKFTQAYFNGAVDEVNDLFGTSFGYDKRLPASLENHYRVSIGTALEDDQKFCECTKKHAAGCRIIFDLVATEAASVTIEKFDGEGGLMSKMTSQNPNGILQWNPLYGGDTEDSTSVLAHELFHGWSQVWKKRAGQLAQGERRWAHAFGGTWDTSTLPNVPLTNERPNGPWETSYSEALAFRVENQILAERGMDLRVPAGNFRLMNTDARYQGVQYQVPAFSNDEIEAIRSYLR